MDVIKKTILFSVYMCTILGYSFAQSADPDLNKFSVSLLKNVSSPSGATVNCSPMMCLMKIETDSLGTILGIDFSDSVDSIYKQNYKLNEYKVDKASLEKYLKEKFFKDGNATIFLIPYLFSSLNQECKEKQIVDLNTFKKYNLFQGELISGNITYLDVIHLKSRIHP